MRDASVAQAYDELAETYAELLPDTRAETSLDLAMLDAFVAAVGEGGRVLDAGCGAGRMSRFLRDRGLLVAGTDLSPGMIRAAQREHPDIGFAVAATQELPFVDGAFDGVMLWYSTIHAPHDDQPALFREAARVLRAGGRLVVAFQAGQSLRQVGAYDAADRGALLAILDGGA